MRRYHKRHFCSMLLLLILVLPDLSGMSRLSAAEEHLEQPDRQTIPIVSQKKLVDDPTVLARDSATNLFLNGYSISGGQKWNPGHYLKLSAKNDDTADAVVNIMKEFQQTTVISGYMLVMFWRDLEDSYRNGRFEIIDQYLPYLALHQSIFILLLDRDSDYPCARQRAIPRGSAIPLFDSEGNNGSLCYPAVWSSAYEKEMANLIRRLAAAYDTDPRFQGLILPETATGRGNRGDTSEGKDEIMQVLVSLAKTAAEHFKHTHFIQGMNWLGGGCPVREQRKSPPECEESAFGRLRTIATTHQQGSGGGIYTPDIVPWRAIPDFGYRLVPSYEIYRDNTKGAFDNPNKLVIVVGNDTSQLGEYGLNSPEKLLRSVYAMATTGYTNSRNETAKGFGANYIIWNGKADAWTKDGKIEGYRDAVLEFLMSNPPVNKVCPTNIVEHAGGCVSWYESLQNKVYVPIALR